MVDFKPIALALLALGATACPAAESDPDPTFGGSPYAGARTVAFDSAGSTLDDRGLVAVRNASGIVIAGTVNTVAGGVDIGITRLTPQGALDTTFGTGGRTLIPVDLVQAGSDRPRSIHIDSIGRYVIGALATNGAQPPSGVVIRLTATGRPDAAWGPGGVQVISAQGISPTGPGVVAVPIANDAVMVVGAAKRPADLRSSVFITRLQSNGMVDTTFGTNGSSLFAQGSSDVVSVNAIAFAGSTLYACGGATVGSSVRWLYLAMVNQAPATVAVLDISPAQTVDAGNDVCQALQPSRRFAGRVYLVGGTRTATQHIMSVVAASTTGGNGLDTSFSGNGIADLVVDPAQTDVQLRGILERGDGKLLLAGSVELPSTSWNAFGGQLLAQGALDSNFSTTGFRLYSGFSSAGVRQEHFGAVVESGGQVAFVGDFQFGPNDPGDFDFAAVGLTRAVVVFENGFE